MSYPKNTNSKHRILFDKNETYASLLNISLRKKLDIKLGEACASPKITNSKT